MPQPNKYTKLLRSKDKFLTWFGELSISKKQPLLLEMEKGKI